MLPNTEAGEVLVAAGMYMEMSTPRTSVLGQTLSHAVFDFRAERAASVRPVPTSLAPVPVLLPGEQRAREEMGLAGCLLEGRFVLLLLHIFPVGIS